MPPTTEPLKAISWSELKTYQRCPKQHEFKYLDRLVPVAKARPLYLGSWGHAALESKYTQGDWRVGHQTYLDDYNRLFKEEQDGLNTKRGKLQTLTLDMVVPIIMKSYDWYYRNDGWKVVAVEQPFEVDTPLKINGRVQPLQGIIDLIVEDEDGRWWIVDHKFVSTIPDPSAFHAMDPQLMLYPWAAKEAWNYNVAGVIYNYVRSRPPTQPKLNRDGSLSKRKLVTDYPTLYRFFKSIGRDPADFRSILAPLAKKSPFLRRYRLPREAPVTKAILLDALSVAKRIREAGRRYRVITRDCAKQCPYHDLCRADLNGFDTTLMRKQHFTPKEERKLVDRADGEYEPDDEDEE